MKDRDLFEELIGELNDEWSRMERLHRARRVLWLLVAGFSLLAIPIAVAFEATAVGVVLFAVALFSVLRFFRQRNELLVGKSQRP
jgi:hypothetical protein